MAFSIKGTIHVPAHTTDVPQGAGPVISPSSHDAVRRKNKLTAGKFGISGDYGNDTEASQDSNAEHGGEQAPSGNSVLQHVPAQDLQTEFNIPTRTVISTIASLGGLSAIIGAIVSGMGFFSNTLPNGSQARSLEGRRMQMQALATALKAPSADERAESVALLLDAGVLEDPSGELRRAVNDPATRARIPRWTGAISEVPSDRPPSEAQKGASADSSPANPKAATASHIGRPPLPAGRP